MISSLFSFDYILSRLNFQEIVSAFIVLFAVIDIFGSTPVIISLKNQGRPVSAWKASSISFALMFGFFLAGDAMLKLFVRNSRFSCFVFHVFGNDSRYYDIQEYGSHKGGNACTGGFSPYRGRGVLYHVAFIKGGVCFD